MRVFSVFSGLLDNSALPKSPSTFSSNFSIASSLPAYEFSCADVVFSRVVCFVIVFAILGLGVFLRYAIPVPEAFPISGNSSLPFVVDNTTNPLCDPYL